MPEPNPKVLIVEDDPEMLAYYKLIVGDAGFRVLTATDGLMAVETMRDSRPDAVILDLMLPRYGGIELIYELQLLAETKSTPIIVATARYTGPAARAAIVQRPNVAAFFEKPVNADALIDALHEILGGAPV